MKRKGNDLNIVASAKISLTTPKLWEQRIACALRDLGNRSTLNQNPLARLAYVENLAQENYKGRLCPRGLALHNVLIECVDKVCQEVGNEPGLSRACNYLRLMSRGLSCQEISKQLGLSREHVSRVYRKKAIELATEEFLSIVNGK